MKIKYLILGVLCLSGIMKATAQSYEAQQLLLDFTKLIQMKQILSDMKTGYQVLSKGYTTVRDISKGNFNLHQAFLDGLWLVSPAVREYWKIPGIIQSEARIVQEYREAFRRYQQSGYFHPEELIYLATVYKNLFDESLKDLDDLTNIVTANKFRMSDEERLRSIDHIYQAMQDKLGFLKQFNNRAAILALQRAGEHRDVIFMQSEYGTGGDGR